MIDLEEQNGLNHSAIGEVWSVNSEICDHFRGNFSFSDKENASTYYGNPNSHQGSNQNLRTFAQEAPFSRRNKVNEEINQNDSINYRLSRLEEENQMLKRERQMGNGDISEI